VTPSQAFADLMAGRIEADEYIERLKAEVDAELARPATRVGRWVMFEGGESRRLGLTEFLLIKAGVKRTVARRPRREA
jgi:hypothetical protein